MTGLLVIRNKGKLLLKAMLTPDGSVLVAYVAEELSLCMYDGTYGEECPHPCHREPENWILCPTCGQRLDPCSDSSAAL